MEASKHAVEVLAQCGAGSHIEPSMIPPGPERGGDKTGVLTAQPLWVLTGSALSLQPQHTGTLLNTSPIVTANSCRRPCGVADCLRTVLSTPVRPRTHTCDTASGPCRLTSITCRH
jgi:hypothetical protein